MTKCPPVTTHEDDMSRLIDMLTGFAELASLAMDMEGIVEGGGGEAGGGEEWSVDDTVLVDDEPAAAPTPDQLQEVRLRTTFPSLPGQQQICLL